MEAITGSMRASVLSVIMFFLMGLIFLLFVKRAIQKTHPEPEV
jgi:MFS-type transporter involved in bile tolerance (Atg22 family)